MRTEVVVTVITMWSKYMAKFEGEVLYFTTIVSDPIFLFYLSYLNCPEDRL